MFLTKICPIKILANKEEGNRMYFMAEIMKNSHFPFRVVQKIVFLAIFGQILGLRPKIQLSGPQFRRKPGSKGPWNWPQNRKMGSNFKKTRVPPRETEKIEKNDAYSRPIFPKLPEVYKKWPLFWVLPQIWLKLTFLTPFWGHFWPKFPFRTV